MSKTTKQSKSKQLSKSKPANPPAFAGLTPAQSAALRLLPRGRKFTARDVADRLYEARGVDGSSMSLARAHVRAWQGAGHITAVTQGSQGVAGVYKRS